MHYIIDNLEIFRKGKVREVYNLGNQMLFVASDRISAFDVIMNEQIPDKGHILNSVSEYWFNNTKHIIKNHFITSDVEQYPSNYISSNHYDMLRNRSMLVRKTEPLKIEFVVRGYIAGSGWKEYKKSGTICGENIPDGLIEYSRLPEPIFTPATKADTGHDENISFEECANIIGMETAIKLKDVSIKLYKFAYDLLLQKGIILADTKFEFGTLESGELILIDEALTPDSSRFWLRDNYKAGSTPTNYDKQVLRDYLESQDWNKQAPAPTLPNEIIELTRSKYIEIYELITGNTWTD